MYEKKSDSIIKHYDFFILDMFLVIVCFYGSYALRYRRDGFYNQDIHMTYMLLAILLDVVAIVVLREYKGILYRSGLAELGKVIANSTFVFVGLVVFSFVQHESAELSRIVITGFYVLLTLTMFPVRIVRKKIITRKGNRHVREVLIVSDSEHIEAFLCRIIEIPTPDITFKGIAIVEENERSKNVKGLLSDIPVAAKTKEDTIDYIQKNVVDEVLFWGMGKNTNIQEILDECAVMGVTVHVAVDELMAIAGETTVEKVAGVPVVSSSIKLVSGSDVLLKRLVDIVGSIVGIIITLIFTIIVGPAIFVSDPGPIFFGQKRVGRNGRIFTMYKFRSMYKDAESRKSELMEKNEMNGLMFKMEHDPRIIGSGKDGTKKGIGWFIRTFSIDELPQFFNVLKGDMSLVGTRPPTIDEWEQYDISHRVRMRVKPGITGLWQVSGRSDISDFEEVVKLDSEYIRSWSIMNDVKILIKTVKVVVLRQGSK